MFELAPELQRDCLWIGDFPLCRLLLLNDANYPWFVLVPRREAMTELCDLPVADQHQFMAESTFLCERLREWFSPDKLNVAALGNVVPQLHIHHVCRYRDDPAWPAPVWGKVQAVAYGDVELKSMLVLMRGLEDFQGYLPGA